MQPPKRLAAPLQPRRAYVLDPDKAGRAPAPQKKGRSRRGRVLGTVVIAVLGTLIVVGITVVLATPGCVKRKAIEACAAQGITLTIEDVQLGSGRLELVGVGATVGQVPEVKAAAQSIDVETTGLTVTSLVAKQLTVTADGPFDKVVADIAAWRAARAGGGGTGAAGAPEPRLVVESGRLVWTKPFGESSHIDADQAHGDLTPKPGGEELHMSSSHVMVGTASGNVGPWRVDYDRDPSSGRMRLLFDPLVPDGPNALVVSSEGMVSTVEVNIARSPLARLGVPAAVVGLPGGDASQLEATVKYIRHSPSKVDLTSTMGLYGVRLEGAPAAIDVKLDAAISGDPEHALDLKKSDLAIGPMKGSAVGTLKPFPDGFRLELAYKAGPVPCAAFAASSGGAGSSVADLADQLRGLAQATGLAKVTGDIRVEGSVLVDTRDLGQTKLSLVPTATCAVTLFPRL